MTCEAHIRRRAFFSVPRFPGSLPVNLSRTEPPIEQEITDAPIDMLIDLATELRVGGTYWGVQPTLPETPYTLIRVRGANAREAAVASAAPEQSVFVSTDPQPCAAGSGPSDPWHLLTGARQTIVDADDEVALMAAMVGIPVKCVGEGPFRALGTGGREAVRAAFRAYAMERVTYVNPFTGRTISIRDAIALCGFWRRLIDSNRELTAAMGFAFWKRHTVAPLLWSGLGRVPFVSKPSPAQLRGSIAIWKTRTDRRTLQKLEQTAARIVEVEDGFIRSTGLGADCIPPLSIIVDRLGVYFDPRRPSELENILRHEKFTEDVLQRARRLRKLIVDRGISKYGADRTRLERRVPERQHLLVPGQVEDDRSVLSGGGAVTTNLELLRRVRASAPDAYIIYKPHPDVEAGHRKGLIAQPLCLSLANEIVRDAPISSLIELVDEVHVNTSLVGFEALLRGKRVTTHGVPFFAGWGLTSDLGSVPERRDASRTLDELVAAALLLYPRYLDPLTKLPCPPEVLIGRLAEGRADPKARPVVRLRQLQGRINRALSKLWSQ